MKSGTFAERLRIALSGVTDPNEMRKRTEEAILEHDARASQTEYVRASHQAMHDAWASEPEYPT